MSNRKLVLIALPIVMIAIAVSSASVRAGGAPSAVEPQLVDDASLKAFSATVGGAEVLPTSRTVPHWWGSTLDPNNGITYGYNMVGADPYACAGTACSVTIETDITPIIVNVDGLTFDGNNVQAATLASPQFALNDYGSTPFATAGAPNIPRGPGGLLSQNDAGNPLQLQDATMRAQFNKTGSSSYHLILHPNLLPAVTINVPRNQGTLLVSGRGVIFAGVNIGWWAAQIQNLTMSADPTHLPVYLTDDVLPDLGSQLLRDRFPRDPRRRQWQRQLEFRRQREGADFLVGLVYLRWHLCPPQRRHQLGAAGHPRHQPRDRRVGRRSVREQPRRAVADADGAAVRMHGDPRDRRSGRRHRLRDGNEYVPAGPESQRHSERRRLLPS